MRPIFRGENPQDSDYEDYRDAFGELAARFGQFCSYCERRIPTQLAVEHIQPKGLPAYAHLIGRWDNFLLGCVNCNSTKGDKDVSLSETLLPDRDNTARAYEYTLDGRVVPATALSRSQTAMAERTLSLTGLDRGPYSVIDSNGQLVAIDRVNQRKEILLIAQESRRDLQSNPSEQFRRQIARTALGHGFFSIWMKVFDDDPVVRRLLIAEFVGTATDCFDTATAPVSPRPGNGLEGAGKV
ncbi:MAG TPA: HNH endonuclease [Pirellulaceae bacterium]|jgi:uncharacterized protein (TIGR02646 family)|nr:HNH endonuclease [Pirellulaceae bacterium]